MIAWLREKLRQFHRHSEGMAAIEMALIFPFMLILYFGLVDVTNLLSANRRVTIAASTIADLVTQEPGNTNKANLNGFYKAVQPIMDPLPTSTVGIQIFDYRMENGAPKLKWRAYTGPTCGGAPDQSVTSGFNKLMTDGNDIVVTRVCVTMNMIVGRMFLKFASQYKLNEQFALRPRQSLTLMCPECQQS